MVWALSKRPNGTRTSKFLNQKHHKDALLERCSDEKLTCRLVDRSRIRQRKSVTLVWFSGLLDVELRIPQRGVQMLQTDSGAD